MFSKNYRYKGNCRSLTAALLLIFSIWSIFPLSALAKNPPDSSQSITPYLERVINQVTQFRLDNGMKFIVLENRDAPVVSFVTYADVGGADEPDGKTGVAHFLEHLAFKGTTRIGTTDYAAEKQALQKLDQIHAQWQAAKQANNTGEANKLAAAFQTQQAEAEKYVKRNEFGRIVETQGGEGLNAQTSSDATVYFYSFPSNKLELWMSLESERFLEPVFREFYKEQEVILEERRMRTDNSPIGRLVESFLDTAYTVHPYKRPVIGYNQDIRDLDPADVKAFFQQYYSPNNLTVAIAGDVNPAEVKRLAQEYFGRFPAQPQPPKVTKVEPPQTEPKEVTLQLASQPWYIVGFHRPELTHPDNAVYEVIATLMSDGRTSRLYKSLVEEKRLALGAQGFNGFPGDKFPNIMLFYATTPPNVNLEDLEAAMNAEIDRLQNEPVSQEELERVKNNLRADLLRGLDSNMGMARALVEYEAKTGDWRNLFKTLDQYAAVTPADIQRVARETFTPENRTIGKIIPVAK
ncbi:MAG: putative zinc protease [Chroococcopsis gigantea SAG 12.99]|jgi:predicted Zn-dependent peptidase|nr:insulinase family protein [Chlorogloea purpurea SAG 13.99]MDV3001687.1 putative zinc protease [Chroococcopsis gigantea SAG 12.99]